MNARPAPSSTVPGFHRVDPAEAWAWIDSHTAPLPPESCALGEAGGRIVATAPVALHDHPLSPAAEVDGFALQAADTQGAGSYSPLPLRLLKPDAQRALGPGEAMAVAAGETLPVGADAVLSLDGGQVIGQGLEVETVVARGESVLQSGAIAGAGATLLPVGRRLRPQDLALLALAGLAEVAVTGAPRVRLCITRPEAGMAGEAMLRRLIGRDGGVLESVIATAEGASLIDALQRPGADLILVVGASGLGSNDFAVAALAHAGEAAFHGVALHPGDTVAAGVAGQVPVCVLPGPPLAGFWAYELLAGRALRRLAGGTGDWPYRAVELPLTRKVASSLGRLECCRIRLGDAGAEPLAVADGSLIGTVVSADGFLPVPVQSEGYAAGTAVTVHLYDSFN